MQVLFSVLTTTLVPWTNALSSDEHFSWLKFDLAEANSTSRNCGNLGANHDVESLLSRGNSFWCAAADIPQDEVVTLALYLKRPRSLLGLHIEWETIPGLVRMKGALHAEDELSPSKELEVIKDWQEISNNKTDQATDQVKLDYFFEKPRLLNEVFIEMKQPRGNHIGISFVGGIVPVPPLFMILSGVTSPLFEDEFCLQALPGNTVQTESELLLDSCLKAISNYDGRELWTLKSDESDANETYLVHARTKMQMRIKSLNGRKSVALTSQSNSSAPIIISPINEIKLQSSGQTTCLTLAGSSPLNQNVALNQLTQASSTFTTSHSSKMAVDGDLTTYWASKIMRYTHQGNFQGSTKVDFIVNLPEMKTIKSLKILWEYPATVLEIKASTGGEDWQLIESIRGNSHLTTTIDFPSSQAMTNWKKIKLELHLPHPHLAMLQQNPRYSAFAYGIRELYVYTAGMTPIALDCDKASQSVDGRNSFFFVEVSKFEGHSSDTKLKIETSFTKKRQNILDANENAKNRFQGMQKCSASLSHLQLLAQKQFQESTTLYQYVHSNNDRTPPVLPSRCSNRIINGGKLLSERRSDREEGLFWTKPRCAQSKQRILCPAISSVNPVSGVTLFRGLETLLPTEEINPGVVYNTPTAKVLCSTIGLEPVKLTSQAQVKAISSLIRSSGLCNYEDFFFPVAFPTDLSGVHFMDFSDNQVYESLLKIFNHPPGALITASKDLVGFSCSKGWYFANWKGSKIGGIICEEEFVPRHIDDVQRLRCEDTLDRGEELGIQLRRGSTKIIRCPDSCMNAQYRLIGDNIRGGYRSDSAICVAAKHSGALKPPITRQPEETLIVIKVLEGRTDYISTTRLGIKSEGSTSLPKPAPFSFSIHPLLRDCPSTSSSPQFKQQLEGFVGKVNTTMAVLPRRHIPPPNQNISNNQTSAPISGSSTSHKNHEQAMLETLNPVERIGNQISVARLLELQAEQTSFMSEFLINEISSESKNVLHKAIELVKPASSLNTRLQSKMRSMIRVLEKTKQSLESNFKGSTSFLEGLQRQLFHVKSKIQIYQNVDAPIKDQDSLGDFYSFHESMEVAKLPPSLNTTLATWEPSSSFGNVPRSPTSKDPSGVDYLPNLNATDVGPPCIIGGHAAMKGSLIFLKEKAYFDGSFQVKYYADSHLHDGDDRGRLGLAFRIQDSENMLLAVLEKVDGGRIAFYHIHNGLEYYLSGRTWSEAWPQGRWIELKVESVRDKHALYIRDIHTLPVSNWLHLGTVQTEFHAGGGSIGLFISSVQKMTFNELTFIPRRCTKIPTGELIIPPQPPVCSDAEEAFNTRDIRKNWRILDEVGTPSVGYWTYLSVYGREGTIAQLNAIDHTQLIWERNRGCLKGSFRFSYLAPMCSEGGVGAVLRMSRQSNGSFIEIMISIDGVIIKRYHLGKPVETIEKSKDISIIVNAWTSVTVEFTHEEITLAQRMEDLRQPDTTRTDNGDDNMSDHSQQHEIKTYYADNKYLDDRVGLVTRKCGGVAFTNIRLLSTDRIGLKKQTLQNNDIYKGSGPSKKPIASRI